MQVYSFSLLFTYSTPRTPQLCGQKRIECIANESSNLDIPILFPRLNLRNQAILTERIVKFIKYKGALAISSQLSLGTKKMALKMSAVRIHVNSFRWGRSQSQESFFELLKFLVQLLSAMRLHNPSHIPSGFRHLKV